MLYGLKAKIITVAKRCIGYVVDTPVLISKQMKQKLRVCISLICACILLVPNGAFANEETTASENEEDTMHLQTPCALLMEASTGTVIYEKNADEQRTPASVTKIMTLLLIYDAIHAGKISLTDVVITSAHAKSMGGSQVFLEEGEQQTVETLIKCIVIASGNDAAVAMAEYIAGTQDAFVQMMNEKAAALGMAHTHFVDCCGLTEDASHYSSARDIAIMSRELILNYPDIFKYSGIWMEDMTHVTKQGTKTFTLTNTNKLLRQFDGCTGLKTGSTSIAKYCLSATADKNQIQMIAVILGAPDSKTRFAEAAALLNYGYSQCSLYQDTPQTLLSPLPVTKGKFGEVHIEYQGSASYLSMTAEDFSNVQKEICLEEAIEAPFEKGTKVGEVSYTLEGREIATVDIVTGEGCPAANYWDCLKKTWNALGRSLTLP